MSQSPPEKVETICRDCVFAIYDKPGVQTDCYPGMLDKFCSQGITLKQYSINNTMYFGIPDRVCLFCRTTPWFNRHLESVIFDKDGMIIYDDWEEIQRELLHIARDEITLQLEVIIYIDKDDTLEKVGVTLDSLNTGLIKPITVIFCDNKNIRPSQMRSWAGKRCRSNWRIEHIREEANFERCIDICLRHIKSTYFAVFHSGYKVPKDFISSLDVALNDNLDRFLVLTSDDPNGGMVIQTLLAKQIGGSLGSDGKYTKDSSLLNKCKRVAKEQKCQCLIKKIKDVVKSMHHNCQ